VSLAFSSALSSNAAASQSVRHLRAGDGEHGTAGRVVDKKCKGEKRGKRKKKKEEEEEEEDAALARVIYHVKELESGEASRATMTRVRRAKTAGGR